MKPEYAAHTHETLDWQSMLEHGSEVSRLAQQHAKPFGDEEKAELAGILHDIGKYGDLFQRRLHGLESGLDHWSPGAHIALLEYRSIAIALAIQGHHIGLQSGAANGLKEMRLEDIEKNHPRGLRLSETDVVLLKKRLTDDGVILPSTPTHKPVLPASAAEMLETRMLFSSLVDADFLDTERTMNRGKPDFVPRPKTPALNATRALEILEQRLEELNSDLNIPQKTRNLRASLATTSQKAALNPARVFTLTAPTGTGKTLAMLRFALTRATKDKRTRRIIIVLPFLTILDQTVDIYRKLFAEFGEHYVLEHHSLTGIRKSETSGDEQATSDKEKRLLTENWDAPIVITTNVQFLESLHANRPSACRKLHNIAESIVLFDEVQTLPVNLAIPTLKTLAKLATEKYGVTVVFATATQPAFDTLHTEVQKGEPFGLGWQPTEIVPNQAELFSQAKRVKSVWKTRNSTPWSSVLEWLERDQQALCIVNLKRHAYALARLAIQAELKNIYHVSTALCPEHRRAILKQVIADLQANKPCCVIATQCVEAGVDLDFPNVYRAIAPLDAIAQAAGRCNRNDARAEKGLLTVFIPESEAYPSKSYQQATELTRIQLGDSQLDLDNPETYRRYYSSLYAIQNITDPELEGFIKSQNYKEFAEAYRLIENDAVNVVVPYNQAAKDLMQEARQHGISPNWMRRVRGYTVSVYLKKNQGTPEYLEPIKYRFGKNNDFSENWFLCVEQNPFTQQAHYHEVFGLLPEEGGI
jgi:CRISPR-associated endonuclease/helicase Cas3